MNLLCSRAKIIFVYCAARKNYRKAQQIVGDLEKKLPEFGEIEREQDRIEQVEFDREKEERERQRDREQIQLYRQKEEEEKIRDRQQMELYQQNEDKEKKRDRQLENIIFFVGTAIGGGQIFSAAYPLIKDTPIRWQPDFSLPLHPFAATILWSLLFGLVFGLLMLGVAVLIRKIFR